MEINEFRAAAAVPAPVVPDKIVRGVRARLKQEVLQRGAFDLFPYRGYNIYHSKITGKWWVMDKNSMLQAWAEDYTDGRRHVDYIILFEETKR